MIRLPRMLAILTVSIAFTIAHAASSLQPRQDTSCTNEDTYETVIGLNFTVHCSEDVPFNDTHTEYEVTDINQCMESCSVGGAGLGPCVAVSYESITQRCFWKANVTLDDLRYKNITESAFAEPSEVQPLEERCPFKNGSVQTVSNGMQFRISCGNDYVGADFGDGSAYAPYHADTLGECMNYCSEYDPLCYGVAWDPSLNNGYRNCYPKKDNTTGGLLESPVHAHFAELELHVNTTCANVNYTSSTGATFQQLCDNSAIGETLLQHNQPSFEDCMDSCATYHSTGEPQICNAVLYQPYATDSFRNCYLKNSVTEQTTETGWRLATIFPGTARSSVPSPGSGNGDGSTSNGSGSKAWIAGAVIGPVVGLALIGVAVYWWRRQKRRTRLTEAGKASSRNELDADETEIREMDAKKSQRYEVPVHRRYELSGS